jgi:hypothetical protein
MKILTEKQMLRNTLNAFIKIKNMTPIERSNFGICHLLGEQFNGLSNFIHDEQYNYWGIIFHNIFTEWPKYSGHSSFPVPVPQTYFGISSEGSLEFRVWWNLNKWSGEYGQSRMELLDFCITTLKQCVKEK